MPLRAVEVQRAPRERVMWGGRVRKFNQATWHAAVVLNMSMTGALLELSCRTEVGDWLMVEMECPAGNSGVNLFTRCATVVRNRRTPSTVAAVGFAPARSATGGLIADA